MLSMILNEVVSSRPPPGPQAVSSTAPAAAVPPPPKFATYLLPSFPKILQRRPGPESSNNAPASEDVPSLSNSPTDSVGSAGDHLMPDSLLQRGLAFIKRRSSAEMVAAPGSRLARVQPDTIRCSGCGSDLAFYSQIVSKGFMGRYGRAYLVAPLDSSPEMLGSDLINVAVGKPELRTLSTGIHTVSDVHCATCRAKVGWKYVDAQEESQKYKIGKFIIETHRTMNYKPREDVASDMLPEFATELVEMESNNNGDAVLFDSEDESECDDLFAGIWDPKTAAKRRKRKGLLRRS